MTTQAEQMLLDAVGLPAGVPEYQFAPPRLWRFDWAWPEHLVALEIDGGNWARGRHGYGKGVDRDHAKLNRAGLLGWLVLHCTRQDFERTGRIFDELREAVGVEQQQSLLRGFCRCDDRWHLAPDRPQTDILVYDEDRQPSVVGRYVLRTEAERIVAAHNDSLDNQQARLMRVHQATMAAALGKHFFPARDCQCKPSGKSG